MHFLIWVFVVTLMSGHVLDTNQNIWEILLFKLLRRVLWLGRFADFPLIFRFFKLFKAVVYRAHSYSEGHTYLIDLAN